MRGSRTHTEGKFHGLLEFQGCSDWVCAPWPCPCICQWQLQEEPLLRFTKHSWALLDLPALQELLHTQSWHTQRLLSSHLPPGHLGKATKAMPNLFAKLELCVRLPPASRLLTSGSPAISCEGERRGESRARGLVKQFICASQIWRMERLNTSTGMRQVPTPHRLRGASVGPINPVTLGDAAPTLWSHLLKF